MNEITRSDKIDKLQRSEYSFPYHYIPNLYFFPNFAKIWLFGASYIAAINIFSDWFNGLNKKKVHKHMDYGCGDGGFLHVISSNYKLSSINFYGVDNDTNAVRWSSLFLKKNVKIICDDINNLPPSEYDSGSLIEVYEHIPQNECDFFLKSISNSLKNKALLFITVPSIEKKVDIKHYRHFNFEILTEEFSKYFEIVKIFGFEKRNFFTKFITKLMLTKWWYFETSITNNYLIKSYSRKKLLLNGCGRIGMIVKKK